MNKKWEQKEGIEGFAFLRHNSIFRQKGREDFFQGFIAITLMAINKNHKTTAHFLMIALRF